ncbi:hypothetical protein [Polluticaenibacter yanchengensis]|uniref:Riboflavin synthase subunit beta n=1 Tax=Polluticaenibacter yanchengensis TaxID=3014562 RepID=A0ABT4UK24_9BACT|nr:hypothetical protein [Chitinophagaceae bacterium LY-5]
MKNRTKKIVATKEFEKDITEFRKDKRRGLIKLLFYLAILIGIIIYTLTRS